MNQAPQFFYCIQMAYCKKTVIACATVWCSCNTYGICGTPSECSETHIKWGINRIWGAFIFVCGSWWLTNGPPEIIPALHYLLRCSPVRGWPGKMFCRWSQTHTGLICVFGRHPTPLLFFQSITIKHASDIEHRLPWGGFFYSGKKFCPPYNKVNVFRPGCGKYPGREIMN